MSPWKKAWTIAMNNVFSSSTSAASPAMKGDVSVYNSLVTTVLPRVKQVETQLKRMWCLQSVIKSSGTKYSCRQVFFSAKEEHPSPPPQSFNAKCGEDLGTSSRSSLEKSLLGLKFRYDQWVTPCFPVLLQAEECSRRTSCGYSKGDRAGREAMSLTVTVLSSFDKLRSPVPSLYISLTGDSK